MKNLFNYSLFVYFELAPKSGNVPAKKPQQNPKLAMLKRRLKVLESNIPKKFKKSFQKVDKFLKTRVDLKSKKVLSYLAFSSIPAVREMVVLRLRTFKDIKFADRLLLTMGSLETKPSVAKALVLACFGRGRSDLFKLLLTKRKFHKQVMSAFELGIALFGNEKKLVTYYLQNAVLGDKEMIKLIDTGISSWFLKDDMQKIVLKSKYTTENVLIALVKNPKWKRQFTKKQVIKFLKNPNSSRKVFNAAKKSYPSFNLTENDIK